MITNMIEASKAYAIISVKSLLKDKVSFIWGLIFPLIMYVINRDAINETDLVYWWTYMLMCSFLYGIGLYTVELRDNGCLRTFFSINESRWAFFIGELITQTIYSLVVLFVFDCIVCVIENYNIIKVFYLSLMNIILVVPVAFGGYIVTLLKKIHYESVKTIISMLLFLTFISVSVDSIKEYNLLNIYYSIIVNHTPIIIWGYIVFSVFSIFIGIIAIQKLNPCSAFCR